MVIDHHAWCKETATASFYDVRPRLGATSTILTQYLQGADVEPPLSLVTALFYGIKTITMGLSRDTSPADAAAYSYLQPRIDDVLSRRCCYSASRALQHLGIPLEGAGEPLV